MIRRIAFVCLGILVCTLSAWSTSFSQSTQTVPAGSLQQSQPGSPQNPGYPAPAQIQQPPAPTYQSRPIPYQSAQQYQTQPQYQPQYQFQTQPQMQPQTQPPMQSQASSPFVSQSTEPLSPFEQYVSGVIPTEVSFDIKQFGYDLFYTAPSVLVPSKSDQGTAQSTQQPSPTQIFPGMIQPSQPAVVPATTFGQPIQGQPAQTTQAPTAQQPPYQPGQPGSTQQAPGQTPPAQTPSGQTQLTQPPIAQVPTTQVLPGQTPALQNLPGQSSPYGRVQPILQTPPQSPYSQSGLVQNLLNQVQGQNMPGQGNPSQLFPQTGFNQSGQIMQGQTLPYPDVPVGPNYVIGPGDEVRITVWGSVEGSWSVFVDRDGNLCLPKVGVIGVTGLKFQELKDLLRKELSKYYTDFDMNTSMGQLKTIRVYIVGNARAPGTYNVSALSTIINALVVSGGPAKSGTMRNIQLKRDGKVVAHLDLYDFLIRGDKTSDERLMPEDVIFIPPIGPIVGVAGNVSRPAIYELKGKARLTDMLKLAGGTTASSYLQRVQVERVQKKESKTIRDLDLQNLKGKDDIFVEDGDILKIFSINSLVTNKIVLQGNVRRPGEYEWKPGMRVSDIISSPDSLLPNSLLDYAVIERLLPPDYHQEYSTFSLDEMLFRHSEKDNVLLQPFDVITIYAKPNAQPQDVVRITGAVTRPGDFQFRQNMKVSDLVKLAGGLKRYAYTREAEIARTIPTQDGPRMEQINVNLAGAIEGDPECDVALREDDSLVIKTVPDWHLYRKVVIAGEVNFPGEYPLKKGETLSSLLQRAGGFTNKAYPRGGVLLRQSVKEIQQTQINDMVNRLQRELNAMATSDVSSVLNAEEGKAVAYQQNMKRNLIEALRRIEANGRMVVKLEEPSRIKNTSYDIAMEDGDNLTIPTNPQTVQVIGAVYNPSSFVYVPKRDYSFYIQTAGGFSASADKRHVYVIKVDGSSVKPSRSSFGWDSEGHQWVSEYANNVEPGDTVVVPDKLESWSWMPRVKDITTMLYQAAVGAGILFLK